MKFNNKLQLLLTLLSISTPINTKSFKIEEATIKQIQTAFTEHKLTSTQLLNFYTGQIKSLNPILRSVIELNPDAQFQAEKADEERRNGKCLGELHGIPVLLKDTIATKDRMNTSAGSYALVGAVAPRDAGVVEKLREGGAVIMGKSSLSEWYKFRSLSGVPNGWCARTGQGVNPYYSAGDPCGSSSGSAISVAANMVSVSLGTETHSSIICPSDHNSVVGFKPTVGLTSRAGVIPVMPSLDTVGPITRTVSDAVYLLDVIVGYDPRDHEATAEAAKFIPVGGYKQFLNPNGLKGKRLGIVRNPFMNLLNESIVSAFEHHLNLLRKKGATVVDNLEIHNINQIISPKQSGEFTLMMAEFKLALNDYLKELITSPVRSLADVIAFNQNNPEIEKIKEYGQDSFIMSEKTNGIGSKEKKAKELMKRLSRDGFEKLMMENSLDAMVTPGSGVVSVLAIGGYPGITVPAGYDGNGMPFGICFSGLKGTEPTLIEIAYDFEQTTMARRPPFLKTYQLTRDPLFGSI
ncbi:probable amidase At4g34880 isoform X2 [Mercurialis annua]|uniref:probable amidase At4g34880 isoform X2 n=1 Tax=Mercurialis annua TaxID=3986 RepID=UPI00215ECF57|nr:probable amidase At4g34880 isoform X2 [Mercurialis annua]